MMKLLKLSSDNPKFKTLIFQDGLNILAGLQLSAAEKQTYNGIGKSFSLNLIHLLLGTNLDKKKQKEKKIQDFLIGYGTFYLEFSHRGIYYKIEKHFADNGYKINDKALSQPKYVDELKKIIVGNDFNHQVSFKQLLNIFARRYGGTYYSDIITQQGRPAEDYYQMYANLALLGIDTSLVSQKAKIKDKLTKLEKACNVIKGYEALLEESNIKDLKDELEALIKDRNAFIIAENYDKFKQQADDITSDINQIRNKIYNFNKRILRKVQSLEQAQLTDIDLDKVKSIYDEAKFFFTDKITVRLEQANVFHQQLMESRTQRMSAEIEALQLEVETLQNGLRDKEKYRDAILKDLNAKGALEEYNSINERIRSIDSEIRELEKFKKMLEDFKQNKAQLDLENAQIQAQSITYLNDSKPYLESVENKFRELVKQFYTTHGGFLQITDTKDAKYLFNIDAHIPRDGSQGVNEVKIFCYDFLLHQLNPDLMNFIAHDGCIFSEMDPRQKSMMFKVALANIATGDLQYFVNIGQSSLVEVLDEDHKINILSEDEKNEIQNSVILKLYDKDPSERLFGTNFG